MSCSSVKHRFAEELKKGLSFQRAMEMYQDVEGSVAAHRTELDELVQGNKSRHEIEHLRQHIAEGENLLSQMKSMVLH